MAQGVVHNLFNSVRGAALAIGCAVAAPAAADMPSGPVVVPKLAGQAPDAALAPLAIKPRWEVPVPAVAPLILPPGPAVVTQADLRAVLAQLAIFAGANDHPVLLQAQSGQTAVLLQQGKASLADLAAAAPEALRPDGSGGWLAVRPVVVWQGAALVIGPDERLRMSGADGAFLLVFGQVQITGAEVSGSGEANPRSAAFRPFLLATASAEVRITGSRLHGLGLDRSGLFGGVTVLASGLFPPASPPVLGDTLFQDVLQVSLRMTTDAQVFGNRFSGGGFSADGGSRLILRDNLLEDSPGGVALRLSGGLRDSVVGGTTILRPQGTGLSVGGLARRIFLGATLVEGAGGDGVSAVRADCLRIDGLSVTQGRSVGLRLALAGHVSLDGARIAGNGRAGIEIGAQPERAPIDLQNITLAANAAGIRGWGTTEVALRELDARGQMPRLLAGDLAPFTAAFLAATEREGKAGLVLQLPSPLVAGGPDLASAASAPGAVTQASAPLVPSGAQPWPAACLTE